MKPHVGYAFAFADGSIVFTKVDEKLQKMGLQNGDVLVAFNGVNITLENAQQEIKKLSAARPGDANTYIVLRNGNEQEVKTTVLEKEEELRHRFKLDDKATPKQLTLRNNWLSNL